MRTCWLHTRDRIILVRNVDDGTGDPVISSFGDPWVVFGTRGRFEPGERRATLSLHPRSRWTFSVSPVQVHVVARIRAECATATERRVEVSRRSPSL